MNKGKEYMKNKKGFSLLAIVVVIAVIGVIGALAWALSVKTSFSSISKPEDMITRMKTELSKNYTLINKVDNPQQTLKSGDLFYTIENASERASDYYKTPGYDFYNKSADGSSILIQADKIPDRVTDNILNLFKNIGLSKTSNDESSKNTEFYTAPDLYIGNGLVCAFSHSSEYANVGCGSIDGYKNEAAKIQPFALLIMELPNSKYHDHFPSLEIKDSSVIGYQKAFMQVSTLGGGLGYGAIFYKKGNDPWIYATGSQGTIYSCDEYTKTEDSKLAFMGESCLDAKGNETIVQ